MFGEPKTGDRLWELMQTDIGHVRETYGVDSIGICTDDGPDGKKMRRLARSALPWWIIVLCWAHQNQLIIGDLIKHVPGLKALIDRALDVIKWFLNHGVALSLLHDEQLRNPDVSHALRLLLPVITRWGAHYFSVSRLLLLEGPVRCISLNKRSELLAIKSRSDDDEGSTKSEDILNIVNDQAFWTGLCRCASCAQHCGVYHSRLSVRRSTWNLLRYRATFSRLQGFV